MSSNNSLTPSGVFRCMRCEMNSDEGFVAEADQFISEFDPVTDTNWLRCPKCGAVAKLTKDDELENDLPKNLLESNISMWKWLARHKDAMNGPMNPWIIREYVEQSIFPSKRFAMRGTAAVYKHMQSLREVLRPLSAGRKRIVMTALRKTVRSEYLKHLVAHPLTLDRMWNILGWSVKYSQFWTTKNNIRKSRVQKVSSKDILDRIAARHIPDLVDALPLIVQEEFPATHCPFEREWLLNDKSLLRRVAKAKKAANAVWLFLTKSERTFVLKSIAEDKKHANEAAKKKWISYADIEAWFEKQGLGINAGALPLPEETETTLVMKHVMKVDNDGISIRIIGEELARGFDENTVSVERSIMIIPGFYPYRILVIEQFNKEEYKSSIHECEETVPVKRITAQKVGHVKPPKWDELGNAEDDEDMDVIDQALADIAFGEWEPLKSKVYKGFEAKLKEEIELGFDDTDTDPSGWVPDEGSSLDNLRQKWNDLHVA